VSFLSAPEVIGHKVHLVCVKTPVSLLLSQVEQVAEELVCIVWDHQACAFE
jgi:hypothetical protein